MPNFATGMKKAGFYTRLTACTGIMALATFITDKSSNLGLPGYTYFALFFLFLLMAYMHYWVYGRPARDDKQVVRRIMAASMIRMIVAATFMGITLYSFRPVNKPYVISYCVYFAVFLLFEISQMRFKLRPDFNPRSK